MQDTNKQLVPLSIIAAGFMIAAAIYMGGRTAGTATTVKSQKADDNPVEIAEVTASDHVLGPRDAQVMVIEYSDLDCPFCKAFHNTMKEAMAGYDGKVAWVYRHFPLTQLHPNAAKKAEAAECVNELGGNEAFWKFTDKLFAAAGTPASSAEASTLANLAAEVNVSKDAFTECYDSGKYAEFIKDSIDSAVKAGARGTPYTVVVGKDGKQAIVNGAEPLASVKSKIDSLLK